MKRFTVLAFLLVFPFAFGFADSPEGEPDGDQKIRQTIEAIQEAAKEPAAEPAEDAEEQEEDEQSLLLEILAKIFAEIFWEYAFSVRFADYPYAENADFFFSTSAFVSPEETKAVSLHSAVDLSCHFDGTFGNTNRVAAHLAAFHLNFYNQNIFAASQSMSILSVNGGFSLIIRGFALSGYLGIYKLDFLDTCLLSFGLSSQIFLPARLYLDIYNLNAVLNSARSVRFVHLTASLNWAVRRFTAGLGYDYSRLAGDTYCGPCLRIGFWL
jgi:hypothetical protein